MVVANLRSLFSTDFFQLSFDDVNNAFHWWLVDLDFHFSAFHLFQLRNLARLDHVEFLFMWFIEILLDSGSVFYDCYSFQERVSLHKISVRSWYFFQRFLWIVSRTNSCSNLFVTFRALLELTGIFNVKPGGTSLRSRHLYRNVRWFVIRANFWFSVSNRFHSCIVSCSYRLDI